MSVKELTELGIVMLSEPSFLCIQTEDWLFEAVSCPEWRDIP